MLDERVRAITAGLGLKELRALLRGDPATERPNPRYRVHITPGLFVGALLSDRDHHRGYLDDLLHPLAVGSLWVDPELAKRDPLWVPSTRPTPAGC